MDFPDCFGVAMAFGRLARIVAGDVTGSPGGAITGSQTRKAKASDARKSPEIALRTGSYRTSRRRRSRPDAPGACRPNAGINAFEGYTGAAPYGRGQCAIFDGFLVGENFPFRSVMHCFSQMTIPWCSHLPDHSNKCRTKHLGSSTGAQPFPGLAV